MKQNRRLVVLFSAILITGSLFGQHTNILVGDSINEFFPEEPCIMLDPQNPDRLLIGANIDNCYSSDDGGYSWTLNKLTSPYGIWGDPCIVVDSFGSFYFFHLSDPPGDPWVERIICQKKETWGDQFHFKEDFGWNNYKIQDKEWATLDRDNNNIYVAWTQWDSFGTSLPGDSSIIVLSKSENLGETWSEPVRLSEIAGDCIGEDGTVEGAVPAIGPDNEVYISWAGEQGIYFDKSYDFGETWLDDDIFVSDIPGGWYFQIPGLNKANGMPITDCDISDSQYRGNIYINWSDQRNGTDDTDIWLVKSTDQGDTWSTPIRVNDDSPGNQQFLTWMDIDQTNGYIYIVFYDRRNYTDTNTDVYLAVSMNGGESFENFKISDAPFIPYSSVFFGDYTNIVAHNNVVRPVWTRLDGQHLSVWTSIVDLSQVGIDNKPKSPVAEIISYPNPFHETNFLSYKLLKSSIVNVTVYNNYGDKVCCLIDNEKYESGKHIIKFSPDKYQILSGVYYFKIIADDMIESQKIIYKD